MDRIAELTRKTTETQISVKLNLGGKQSPAISTGIPFFDHMLTLFSVHGFFYLSVNAKGDLGVDFHHTVEDVGLVLGEALDQALGDRKGIKRYGHAVTPMDDALSAVTVDLSNRPYLVFNVPGVTQPGTGFDFSLTKEFFRAFAVKSGMNLHINVSYGENGHHIIESIFKAAGRALAQAVSMDKRITHVRSTKGLL
jgi:imidazoleglycerol-phosphate dehydratase